MNIEIPKLSLVVLIGASGSGKSSFARQYFQNTEVLSSDHCRALVSDDENSQQATKAAFEVLHFIAGKRLAAGKLAVIDAANVQKEARKPLIALARQYHALPIAIVLDLPEKVCQSRNKDRPDRNFGSHVIKQQQSQLRRSLRKLKSEGFRHVFKIRSVEDLASVSLQRVPLWNDKRDIHGPFDIVGDVHGCAEELIMLLNKLGYQVVEENSSEPWIGPVYGHPDGRIMVFLGDIVDRGPRILDTLKLVYNMVTSGHALLVPGNHDMKLCRKLSGKDVQITHGLQETMQEINSLSADQRQLFLQAASAFLFNLISHFVLDDGNLVVAHAGLKEEMQGRGSGKVREFCLYGETTGEIDEFGLPVRYNWAAEYRGPAMVVYGHTPVPEPEWVNRTINIDTGCVFGGKLTALRYPEKELISVDALHVYQDSIRPLLPKSDSLTQLTTQQEYDDLLDAEDVIGKRIITARLRSSVTIREENATAALEVMSRFAANPKWLIYLPPTMSPSETSGRQDYLEYPDEAFAYFRNQGISEVVCQKKHMGSRAVVIVCNNEQTVVQRFGIKGEGLGIVYTRTGRRFFNDRSLESQFLTRLGSALTQADFWSTYNTDWICLDCELMPWSEKAQELLKSQYAATGAAATVSLDAAVQSLQQTMQRDDLQSKESQTTSGHHQNFCIEEVLNRSQERQTDIQKFIQAYQQYCWPVAGIEDLQLAPFHILATEGYVHTNKDHRWHMETLATLCANDSSFLLATPYQLVDVTDKQATDTATRWWEELTQQGGEGMVVKPHTFIAQGKKGLVQPAVKCRGREYLRIIYGPDYTTPAHLEQLHKRSLRTKRSLALREFALGIEALDRFVRKEPLRRVHECVFGVLALESEPVDPRL